MLQAQGVGGTACYQAALMQNQQVIAGLDLVQQVGGPQHAELLLAAQPPHVLVEGQAAGRVEADTGFVKQ